jgi:hypothetical protein
LEARRAFGKVVLYPDATLDPHSLPLPLI